MSDPQSDAFGRYALRRGYVTAAQLDECRTIQSCQQIPAPLELILVERGYIDDRQLQELLNLVESGEPVESRESEGSEAPGSDAEPLDLRQDMLFGRVVVLRHLVPADRMNSCVAEQGRLAQQGKRVRLGKLLVLGGHLTMKQVLEVLEALRTEILYCERCAGITQTAIEAGKSYACSGCGTNLTTPQEITSLRATDLFGGSERDSGGPARVADAAADTLTGGSPEPRSRLGPKDITARLPVQSAAAPESEDSDVLELEEDPEDRAPAVKAKAESGYTPKGAVEEVQPTRPKSPAAAVPPSAKPGGKPVVVIGKGGGVRAVEAGPATPEERVWHYAIQRKVQGPVTAEQIRGFLAEGKLTVESLIWRKGMQDWQPLGKQPEFKPARSTPAATPAASPSNPAAPATPAQELQRKLRGREGDTMMVRRTAPRVDIAPPKLDGYKILEVIGKGGMGIVYKAYQESMDRTVAIKVMVPKYSEDPEFVERFTREARASAKVNHPNIIQGIDVKQVDGKWCFIMEYADGQRVGDVIRRGGAMSEARALKIVTEIASALEHAHRNLVVHRDVKPDNIIITKDGVAKLCDLGLVKVVSEDTENSKVGDLIGTPDYMSPEQASGKPDVDHRADIYCLGAAWYHMVTGRVPYPGPNRTVVLMKHLTEPLQPPDEVNPMVTGQTASVIERMLEKPREERYQTVTELLKDLQLLSVGANPSTFEAEPPPQPDKPQARRPGRPLRMRRRRFR